MDHSGDTEVDSTQDSSSKPDEEQVQNMEEEDTNSKSEEKLVQSVDDNKDEVSQSDKEDTTDNTNVMEWDELRENTEEVGQESNDEKQHSGTTDNSECETNMAVVIMEDELLVHSEDSNIEADILDKESSEARNTQSQELEKDELVNPLATSEQESTDKESEHDVLEVITVDMPSVEKSDGAEICSESKTNEDSRSSEGQFGGSVTLEQDKISENEGLDSKSGVEDGDSTVETHITEEIMVESGKSKLDDSEDIVELPVHKQPAMLVDLENEDEVVGKNQTKSVEQNDISDSSLVEDKAITSEGKRIKLRSLASLVDITGGEDSSTNKVISTSHPDIPAIGEIVEHGVIIGSDEMDGLHLRISNVVGGEDCITGLTVDEDRDSFSSIQISSVTTLIDPMSPEDPNQANDTSEKPKEDETSEKEAIVTQPAENENSSTGDPQSSRQEEVASAGVGNGVAVSPREDGKKTVEKKEENSSKDTGKSSGDKDDKSPDDKDSENSESSPKIRLSSVVSEVAKDTGSTDELTPRHVYHILRSILTVKRECLICCKNVQCEFRIVKKDESGSWAFLCSAFCRSQWTASLTYNHVLEKPRLIFEKLCGMCGKDLANLPRDGQYSWETREFCSKDCLTQHLNEVAGRCHMCSVKVRTMLIGKYCVRFGSDIHQFCSNTCLECYKTKIKVCCYCQKNLETVDKVTSISNKEYCSKKCLKRAQRRDIGQQNYGDQLPCTVCQTNNLNRYEFVSNQESYQLCSDPCLNVYKYANKVKAVPCCLCFRVMNAEDVAHYLYHGGHQLRVFCSDSCVNVFILSARKIVVCEACKVKKYNFDMIHRQVDEDFRDYFYCSLNCLSTKEPGSGKKNKNGVTSASSAKSGSVTSSTNSDPPVTNCNMCSAMAKAQYHMVMSDNSLRSFCRYACATKYKNTFGFHVNGIQSSDSSQDSGSVPVLREKPSQKSPTSHSEATENTPQMKKRTVCDSVEEVNSVTAELLRLLTPPTMVNKMTSCRPGTVTKGVFCKPHPWHRETQTESSDINCSLYTSKPPPVIPVPVPVYVPTPVMCNMPYPVPVFVPIPLPVPIFIPTSARTSKDIAKMMNKIQAEMPEDPYEAEMLLLARASSESVETEALVEGTQENPSVTSDCASHVTIDDLKDIDVSCLDSVEEDIPRYPLKPLEEAEIYNSSPAPDTGNSEEEDEEHNQKKRKFEDEEDGPRKRVCHTESQDSLSDTEDREPQHASPSFTTDALGEEYSGPYLNKMYGLAAWKNWVTTKNAELARVSSSRNMKMMSDDLLSMNCEELNYALCLFLKDLRKPSGEPYQADTVFYLLLGIQQHLFDSARTDCIFMDFGFEKLTNSFDEITKTFLDEPTASSSDEVGGTRITETILWECRQLGAHTPQVLLNTLFYFNTKVFKLKTVEDHQALSFPQMVKQWRRTVVGAEGAVMRTTLLKYFAPKKDGKKRKVLEMHENRDDPLRCPVKLYEFYLSKCPESLRNQQGIYYVYPERSCVPDSPTWFSSQAVQPGSLAKMLHRALMVKEVQETFLE